jgi:hypothetical protein
MKEEKELVEEQVGSLQNQVEAQNLVVRKLEEKERLLYQNLASLENELRLKMVEWGASLKSCFFLQNAAAGNRIE